MIMQALRNIMLTAAALTALACAKDINERKINEGSGLGYPEKVCDLEAEPGQVTIPVIATRTYAVRTDASWLSVPATAPAGKEGFTMEGLFHDFTLKVAHLRPALTLEIQARELPKNLLRLQGP